MTNAELIKKAETYLSVEENESFRKEIQTLLDKGDFTELSDRFWQQLDFGTGGLRGIIGGGDNRMNPYVVRKSTQGMANYIISRVPESERSIAIAYDSRHYSDLFAQEAARVMATNGIKCYLFSSLRPTPVLSYAVRQLGTCAGIMVTASHNPAAYNGYKVYWSDGAQVVPPHDRSIIAEVRKVSGEVKVIDFKKAQEEGLIVKIDSEIDRSYQKMVVGQSLRPELIKSRGGEIKTVYTPLHGTGTIPVENVFKELGIPLITVPEQREPDGDFPTVEFPNPEMAPALEMALSLAKKNEADLVLATDPDGDRLGIAVPGEKDWILVTGNQLGALLADYIFRTRKESGTLPANPAFINTIVSSELQNRIADSYGAKSFRVLTGFKYIGEKIRQFESEGNYSYVFGGEESYGYLVGTEVRDKDAVSAAAMVGELAIWNRSRGLSLMDHLKELWKRFGYWKEILISSDFEGESGQKNMATLMESLRSDIPKSIAGKTVTEFRDYRGSTTYRSKDKSTLEDIHLPSSDVLQILLEDSTLITARPSGTEPKIKFYVSCRSGKGDNPKAAEDEVMATLSEIKIWVNSCIASVEN